jgi:ribosomal protein S18 acetylase RimI-like enzyme
VGAAKTHLHSDADGEAPAGHYLGGIVVAPGHRRHRVGSALSRLRLDWISARASAAYYFTDEQNSPSIAMHKALGFQLIGPFASIRGVTADVPGSSLLLFQLSW